MRVLLPLLSLLVAIGCGPAPGGVQVGGLKVAPQIFGVGFDGRQIDASIVNGEIIEDESGYWLVADRILLEDSSGDRILFEMTLYEDLSGNGAPDVEEPSVEFEVGAPVRLGVSGPYPRLRAKYEVSEWPSEKVLLSGERGLTFE